MTLTEEEKDLFERKLRIRWLRDLLTLYVSEDNGVKTIRTAHLKKMLKEAEADEIELTDKEAAERHRKLDPEW